MFYQVRKVSGHICVLRSIHFVSVSTIIFWNCSYSVVYFVFDLKLSYMCVRIAVFYQARRVSDHIYICVRIAVFYQARRVSDHIYICVRIAVFYQARRVSGHMCVLGLQCFTRPGE